MLMTSENVVESKEPLKTVQNHNYFIVPGSLDRQGVTRAFTILP